MSEAEQIAALERDGQRMTEEIARLRAERDCWEKLARAFDSLCVAYRIGGRASEKALSTIRAMKEKLKF